MKKKTLFFTCCLLFAIKGSCQEKISLPSLAPEKEFENILSRKIAGDSLSTGFVIWIKKEVKSHKHLRHSETIYFIEGEGIMKMGETSITMKAGDYLFIPAGTVHSLKVTSSTPVKVLSVQSPEFNGDDRVFSE